MKKVVIIPVLVILIGAFVFYYLSPGQRSNRIDKYLEQDSVWRYQNEQNNIEMELLIGNDEESDNLVKYNLQGKKGKWSFTLNSGLTDALFLHKNNKDSYIVWTGRAKIKSNKITINDIKVDKNISYFVQKKKLQKQVVEETLPKEIEEIVFERVK